MADAPTASDVYAQVSALVASFNTNLAQFTTWQTGSVTGGAANPDGTGTGGPWYPLTTMSGATVWVRCLAYFTALAAAGVPSTGGVYTGEVSIHHGKAADPYTNYLSAFPSDFGAGNFGVFLAKLDGLSGFILAMVDGGSGAVAGTFNLNAGTVQIKGLRPVTTSGGIAHISEPGTSYAALIMGEGPTAALNSHVVNQGDGNVFFFRGNFGAGTLMWGFDPGSHFVPGADNAFNIASAARRAAQVFAAAGQIQTSDAREKTWLGALDDAELRVATRCAKLLGKYRWTVKPAGRIHFGLQAQDVRDAFVAEGLDGTRYGVLCYDKWDAIAAQAGEPADPGKPAVFNADGVMVSPETPASLGRPAIPAVPAGDRWGVRYDELAAFVMAGQEQRLAALEAKAA